MLNYMFFRDAYVLGIIYCMSAHISYSLSVTMVTDQGTTDSSNQVVLIRKSFLYFLKFMIMLKMLK
jgi:hypothetical protein